MSSDSVSPTDIIGIAKIAYKRRYSIWGLAIYEVLGFLLLGIGSKAIESALIHLGFSDSQRQITFFLGLGAIVFGIIIWWGLGRKKPFFRKDEIGIIFAFPDFVDKAEQLRKLYDKLVSKVASDTSIKVKWLPSIHAPSSATVAHALREESNASLVIWGPVDQGKIAGKESTVLPTVTFSYLLRDITPETFALYGHTINLSLAGKKFIIEHDNEIIDRTVVAENIEITAKYVIGISLATAKKFSDAVRIMDEVINELPLKNNPSKNEKDFLMAAKKVFADILVGYSGSICPTAYPPSPAIDTKRRYLISKAESLAPLIPPVLLASGVIAFQVGNILLAREKINKARKVAPGHAAPNLSNAFLAFFDGSLDEGCAQLDEALRKTNSISLNLIFQILRFYDEVLENHPEHIELLYPFGFLNVQLVDRVEGREIIEEFISKFNSTYLRKNHEQERLVKSAQALLIENP